MLVHSLFTLRLSWCTYPQSVSLSPFFSYLWSSLYTPAILIWPSFSSSQRLTASSCSLYLNSPTWWKGLGPICLQLSLLTTIWKGASLCSGQWKWSVIPQSGDENRSQEFCPRSHSSWVVESVFQSRFGLCPELLNTILFSLSRMSHSIVNLYKFYLSLKATSFLKLFLFFLSEVTFISSELLKQFAYFTK